VLEVREPAKVSLYSPLMPRWLLQVCTRTPLTGMPRVGGLIEAFEEVLDLGIHLLIPHGLGQHDARPLDVLCGHRASAHRSERAWCREIRKWVHAF
jgi:hypothetical protein